MEILKFDYPASTKPKVAYSFRVRPTADSAVQPALLSAALALQTHRKELARWVGQFFLH